MNALKKYLGGWVNSKTNSECNKTTDVPALQIQEHFTERQWGEKKLIYLSDQYRAGSARPKVRGIAHSSIPDFPSWVLVNNCSICILELNNQVNRLQMVQPGYSL